MEKTPCACWHRLSPAVPPTSRTTGAEQLCKEADHRIHARRKCVSDGVPRRLRRRDDDRPARRKKIEPEYRELRDRQVGVLSGRINGQAGRLSGPLERPPMRNGRGRCLTTATT